jgi:phosphatidyl-myo-inositol dimannoside synthase
MKGEKSPTRLKRVVGLFPELLGVGGVQEAGRLTAAALGQIAARHGWPSEFLSLNDSPSKESLAVATGEVAFRGFGREKGRFALSLLRSATADNPLVILAVHPHLAPPAVLAKCFAPKARLIVMSHGVEVWKPLPWVRRSSLQRADFVLAPSRDTAGRLAAAQGVSRDRIRVLPWPLSPNFLEMADRASALPLPRLFPSAPSDRVILTVGRWAAAERYKGVDHLIRAVAQLGPSFPGLHLVAVGGGDDLPRLSRIAAEAGIAHCVHFLEGLSREEIAACYAHCDAFALPSTGEGFGLVFLEAMAFAKPVVGAACGGIVDIVQDGVNGLLVSPGDVDSLARALARLLEAQSLRAELGHRGAETVRHRYAFKTFEAELERILEQVA